VSKRAAATSRHLARRRDLAAIDEKRKSLKTAARSNYHHPCSIVTSNFIWGSVACELNRFWSPVMGVANQVHHLEIVKELYDLIFPRNQTVRDATYLGWGPEESVAYEDYLKQLSSLRRQPEVHPSPTAPEDRL
jgi:hypothetical protein